MKREHKQHRHPVVGDTSGREDYRRRACFAALDMALSARRPVCGEYASPTSYAKSLERQREFAFWALAQKFDFHITINSNDPRVGYSGGWAALKKFGAILDRFLLGKSWYSKESGIRTLFSAVPEHVGGELHYHVLLKLPSGARRNRAELERFFSHLTELVKRKKVFPRGDAHVQPLSGFGIVEDSGHRFRTTCYVVKDLWRKEEFDNCVISTEFHRW